MLKTQGISIYFFNIPPAIMGTFSYSWLKITGLTCCEDLVIVI